MLADSLDCAFGINHQERVGHHRRTQKCCPSGQLFWIWSTRSGRCTNRVVAEMHTWKNRAVASFSLHTTSRLKNPIVREMWATVEVRHSLKSSRLELSLVSLSFAHHLVFAGPRRPLDLFVSRAKAIFNTTTSHYGPYTRFLHLIIQFTALDLVKHVKSTRQTFPKLYALTYVKCGHHSRRPNNATVRISSVVSYAR